MWADRTYINIPNLTSNHYVDVIKQAAEACKLETDEKIQMHLLWEEGANIAHAHDDH